MAYRRQALIIFLLLSLFTFSSAHPDNGGIAVYWGQDSGEGDLTTTCDTGKYAVVVLSFLHNFGAGRTPTLNLAGHCDNGVSRRCTELESEIKHCQAKGIRVLLSIGGPSDNSDYSLTSAEDAKNVANYLHTNFLSAQYGPLGRVTLNGISFDIEKSEEHWDNLAKELDTLRRTKGHYFFLSATPQCQIPTPFLGKAIATNLFEYIFVQFRNNPLCTYSNGDVKPVLDTWDKWVDSVLPNNSLFLGLPARAGSGYIPPHVLNSHVLPHAKKASNYEGVALWDRQSDRQSDYSGNVLSHVLKSPLLSVTSVTDAIYECVSKALHGALPYVGS
ncbi:hevamine-A [Cajanus cajan]|uniref:Acidic endochitinase n=1 Tax=Cajanus cajan TaxID=3821 RepID=A0A151R5A2_CAJCA|nr:hevamine-A [Cajanus cajan]KYP37713.1 Acidic endochitinase [Cajanus cajan]